MAEDTGLQTAEIATGDDVLVSQYNNLRGDILGIRQQTLTAGETIVGATLPVAVYQKKSDNEIYACDADDANALEFIGFAITNGTDTNDIVVQQIGVVGGFTGLVEGTRYYVQDDKTIGTTPGTYCIQVGIAISETQLFIMKGNDQYISSAADSSDIITVPADANKAIIDITITGGGQTYRGEVTIYRCQKTSGVLKMGFDGFQGSASWSGSSITLSTGAGATAVAGTAYFYR